MRKMLRVLVGLPEQFFLTKVSPLTAPRAYAIPVSRRGNVLIKPRKSFRHKRPFTRVASARLEGTRERSLVFLKLSRVYGCRILLLS